MAHLTTRRDHDILSLQESPSLITVDDRDHSSGTDLRLAPHIIDLVFLEQPREETGSPKIGRPQMLDAFNCRSLND